MKKTLRLFGLIAMAAIIGFSCDNGTTSGGGGGGGGGDPLHGTWKAGDGGEITLNSGRFVAVGVDSIDTIGVGTMAYSTDGANWTAVTTDVFNLTIANITTKPIIFNAIAYGNNKFVVYGTPIVGGEKTAYSTDGINWTVGSSITGINAIAYGNGTWVAGGLNGKMWYSKD